MTTALLVIFALECVAVLVWSLLRKGRVYTFPFLAGATFSGFVLPQLIGLSHVEDLPGQSLDKTILMSILCQAMCYLGWNCRRPKPSTNWTVHRNRLLWVGIAYVAIGAYFFFLISRLPHELTESTQWSGLPVAYYFFANVLSYGFAIVVVMFAAERSLVPLLLSLYATIFYADRILFAGRRGIFFEFVFIVLCAFWFRQKLAAPRGLMLAAVVLASLGVYSTGDYRSMVTSEESGSWRQVSQIPFVDNLVNVTTYGGDELRNAAYYIEAADRSRQFDYGLFNWNGMVANCVPAQWFGADFKAGLMAPIPEPEVESLGFVEHLGFTITGMADCFMSFWYLGCIKFFIVAYILRILYDAAEVGNVWAGCLQSFAHARPAHCDPQHANLFQPVVPHRNFPVARLSHFPPPGGGEKPPC